MKADSFPTLQDFREKDREISEQDSVIRRTEKFRKLYNEVFQDNSVVSYPYIPMHDSVGLYEVFCMAKKNKLSLLDIGAGTGRIIALAKFCGISAAGLEYQELYVKAGRKLFGLSEEELFVGDAFEISPETLSEYGLIYTYMPIRVAERMTDLHFSLYQKSAPGTKFVEMLPSYYPVNYMRYQPTSHGFTCTGDFVVVDKRKLSY